jgi:hypothetical protein
MRRASDWNVNSGASLPPCTVRRSYLIHADTTTRLRFPDRRERGPFRGVNGAATSENHSSATFGRLLKYRAGTTPDLLHLC